MKLETRYANARNPIGFSGKNIISRYSKRSNKEKLRKNLTRIPTYVLHREAKRPRVYNPFILYEPRLLLQADLVDMVSRSKFNKGMNYILVVVDAFTRFCWAQPASDKSGEVILELFKKIYKKAGPFKRLMTDAGSEFIAGDFQDFLTENGIQYIRGNPHAPHVERLNRTLQGKLFKYMTQNETNKWVSVLPKVVAGYNERYHSTIKMSPLKAENSKNRSKLIENLTLYYEKALSKRKKPKLKIGDVVSMQKEKSIFGKGYTQVFTDELFKIYEVHDKLPIPMYTLIDFDHDFRDVDSVEDNLVHGRFYENELQLANYDVFKVDKELKRRTKKGRKEVFVSWKGWPKKYNQWIPVSNVSRVYTKQRQ